MRILLAGILVCIAGTAQAEFDDGESMTIECSRSPAYVMGYVAGWLSKQASDTNISISALPAVKDEATKALLGRTARAVQANICLRAPLKLAQVRDVVCKYLTLYPDVRALPMDKVMEKAISHAWPCSK